jgi:hypothetical protein
VLCSQFHCSWGHCEFLTVSAAQVDLCGQQKILGEGAEDTFEYQVQAVLRYELGGCSNAAAPVLYSASLTQAAELAVKIAPQALVHRRSLVENCSAFPTSTVQLDFGRFTMTEKQALDLVFFQKIKFSKLSVATK